MSWVKVWVPDELPQEIFDLWNRHDALPKHQKITSHVKGINKALAEHGKEALMAAIAYYAMVLSDPQTYFFSYRWTLGEFCQRGVGKFLPEMNPLENFKTHKQPVKQPSAVNVLKVGAAMHRQRLSPGGFLNDNSMFSQATDPNQ